jgi:hypothetical protein
VFSADESAIAEERHRLRQQNWYWQRVVPRVYADTATAPTPASTTTAAGDGRELRGQ